MKYWKHVVCALVMMVWSWGCGNQEVVTILVGDALAADVPAQIQVSQGLPQGELCVCQNGSEWPLEVTGEYILFLPTEAIAKASELEIRPCDKLIASVNIRRSNGALRVSKQEKEVFSFVEEIKLPDANTPNYYGRNGFIDPMRSPAGVKLTEAYPRGHTHQHGIFHAWTRSTISGKMIDFWNQAAQLGNVRLVDVEQIEEGPVVASFVANLEYLAYLEQDTIVAAHEQWIVQTYAGPEQAHVVDVEIIHTPKVDTLVLPKYHYGGFGYRANDAWNFEGTDASPYDSVASVLTSLGDDHTTANHTRPEWVTMWGSISDRIAGIAILSHPTNFRHPQPVRVHPVMPYFTFAPMVLGEFKLLEGAPYRARYRIATYDGQPNTTFLDNLQQSFARL